MVEGNVTFLNETGLHARPASLLVAFAKQFDKTEIFLIKDDKKADAKSILNLLTLGLSKGSEITVQIEGENEEEALKGVINFIANLKD